MLQTKSGARRATVALGALPVALLTLALSLDHIPFTDVALTVPYAAEGPGPTFNTLGEVDGTPVVEIDGAPTDSTAGNLNMTTVSVRTNMTLAQALGRWLGAGDTIVPIEQIIPPEVSEDDLRQFNEQAFVGSEASATVAAMRYLGLPTTVVVYDALESSAAHGVLEPGDVITAVGDTEVTEPGQVQRMVREMQPGDELQLGIQRGDEAKELTVTLGESSEEAGQPQLGILMTSEPAGDVDVTYNLNDVGGPSAGMMFALAVIDKLSPGQLNGGRFVAGTGTIHDDGTVGPIGGIAHKIEASRQEGAELFLAPSGNCDEASRAEAGEMVVARVDTLDDAVAAMEDFSAGREVASCSPESSSQ
ncbi:PDZ domain-containing protein [Corynebacterium sp.]|uniref:YlbL family protein n=1 Tax=Corynebacterium sp. TaxID=1720 RepID=UPI002A912F85|nr:PDZ domain-containing protein [Corynebacterium sp.]MDY5786358.1 PDZ domain-containing protein [Corynebacterium sp.]